MFRHSHISKNNEPVSAPDSFESSEKEIPVEWVIEERLPPVATERYEVKIAPAVEALRVVGHVLKLQKKTGRCL